MKYEKYKNFSELAVLCNWRREAKLISDFLTSKTSYDLSLTYIIALFHSFKGLHHLSFTPTSLLNTLKSSQAIAFYYSLAVPSLSSVSQAVPSSWDTFSVSTFYKTLLPQYSGTIFSHFLLHGSNFSLV